MENCDDNICIQFLRNKRCIYAYCQKKHKEVCTDWQENKCLLGNTCPLYHPKVNCFWEVKKRGLCKHGINCSFNHNLINNNMILNSIKIKDHIIKKNLEKNKVNVDSENQLKIQNVFFDSLLNKLNERKMMISSYISKVENNKKNSELIVRLDSDLDIEVINSEIKYYEKYLKYYKRNQELKYKTCNKDIYIKLYETNNIKIKNARKIFGIENLSLISINELSSRKDILLSKFTIFDIDENYIKNFIGRITQIVNESYDIIFNII